MRARPAAVVLALAAVVLTRTAPLSAQPAAAAPDRVVIDAAAVGAPISPLVYGQFIEHLGRCIYGGLWAEMLEDRKFYYPVTGEAPAWEMFTPGTALVGRRGPPVRAARALAVAGRSATRRPSRMVREGALAGEHSPQLAVGGAEGAGRPEAGAARAARGPRVRRPRSCSSGEAAAGPVEVSLVWGGGASDRQTIVLAYLGRGLRDAPAALPRRRARPTTAGSRSSAPAARARSASAPSR